MGVVAGFAVAFAVSAQGKSKTTEIDESQVLEIQKQFELLKSHRGEVLDIREVDGKGWIQACMGNPGEKMDFMFAFYPTNEPPRKVFAAIDMKLPEGWEEGISEPETFWSFRIAENDATNNVPRIIHEYFTKFLKRSSQYKLTFKR